MLFKRHEIKYYLNESHMHSLIYQLSKVMDVDKYCYGLQGYKVRSLYFDSIDDECLYQKQSGFDIRSKIRLRTYGNSTSELVKLEVKSKRGQLINKMSFDITRESAEEINSGDYRSILNLNSQLANNIYARFKIRLYKPKVIVEYNRLAFVSPVSNLRITFDMDLKTNISHIDLFSDVSQSMPVILESKQIMEVKFEEFISGHVKSLLSNVALEKAAISKYTLSRRFNKLNKWEDN